MIEIIDNFLSTKEYDFVLEYCKSASYTYGERDDDRHIPTGMVYNISETESIYNLFEEKTKKIIRNLKLYRMYINCFAPTENPYFHTDGGSGEVTFLYYPNEDWDLEDGGETQFFVDGYFYGVTPIPNRMIFFDASIIHKATSFKDRHRFSVAIKYGYDRNS